MEATLPITRSKPHKMHDHNQSSDIKTFEKNLYEYI